MWLLGSKPRRPWGKNAGIVWVSSSHNQTLHILNSLGWTHTIPAGDFTPLLGVCVPVNSGWWFGIFVLYLLFFHIGNNHPNSLIFSRGVGQPPTRKIIKCNKLPSNHFDMFELVFKLLFRRQNQHPLRMNRWYQASKYGWFIVALLTLLVFFAKRPDPTPFVFPQKKWPS